MKYILLNLLFITALSFSQKREFVFDYLLEYEITFHKQNFTEAKYYLTNSKDNSYVGILKEADSSFFELVLRHHGKAYSKVKLLKSEFYKSRFINISCKNVEIQTKKIKIKDNILESTKDTLIEGNNYYLHKIELKNKPKKEKRKKGLITKYYIISKTSVNHLPVFEGIYGYERWLKYENMPNGIYNQQLQIDLLNQPHATEILQSYHNIDKKIMILGDCPEPIKFNTRF
ncbi:hypothetical protein [Hanstruepera marina]|uniref:hypothetical protein n=1 Tax=Hanstruepera marina TaxID=2873265 RepID=UPI001CA62361|nr:hypothetical protein [Hanstruepera marina]